MESTPKWRLAILGNEMPEDTARWINACTDLGGRIQFEIIDLTRNDWFERIDHGAFDGLLTVPSGWTTHFKTLYDERATILDQIGRPMYPSLTEIQIFENKKFLSYWLKAHGIPFPKTDVFYHKLEALDFLELCTFPIVGKTNLGAGGSGVRVLRSLDAAKKYVARTFSEQGAPRSVGPKWKRSGFFKKALRKLSNPGEIIARLAQYRTIKSEVQRDIVLFQEFIPHDFEWRVVRIGDSFFAHKKLLQGDKASGSLIKEYGAPPLEMLDLVRGITDKHGLRSQAVDLFETNDGRYLVNEMQCIFGQSDPHQMIIDDVPGRYRHLNEKWVFEAGEFNRHESFLLRLEYFLEVLSERRSTAQTPSTSGSLDV